MISVVSMLFLLCPSAVLYISYYNSFSGHCKTNRGEALRSAPKCLLTGIPFIQSLD